MPQGYHVTTERGVQAHVLGDPNPSPETAAAIEAVVNAAYDMFVDHGPRVGYDVPLPNGCYKCIGCGVILPKRKNWNQCADCDTRDYEDY